MHYEVQADAVEVSCTSTNFLGHMHCIQALYNINSLTSNFADGKKRSVHKSPLTETYPVTETVSESSGKSTMGDKQGKLKVKSTSAVVKAQGDLGGRQMLEVRS